MRFDRSKFLDTIKPTAAIPKFGWHEMQLRGLNTLLDFIEGDSRWDEMDEDVAIRILAYFMGTIAHECTIKVRVGSKTQFIKSFQPVEEMGGNAYLNRMYDTRTDLGNTAARDGDGAKYGGDGYVQNTGGNNARTTGSVLSGMEIRFEDIPAGASDLQAAFARLGGSARTPVVVSRNTFIREHELLRVPKISYYDAVDGMLSGRYTGKKITDYINARKNDTYNARRVINGITSKNKHTVVEMQAFAAAFQRAFEVSLLDNAPTPAPPSAEPEIDEVELPELPELPEGEIAQSATLATPVAIERAEPEASNSATAFEAIQRYGKTIGQALGITSAGGVVSAIIAKLTGINIPPQYVEYVAIAVGILVMLIVLFGGLSLIIYVGARFFLTNQREARAHELNMAAAEAMSDPNKQSFTFRSK